MRITVDVPDKIYLSKDGLEVHLPWSEFTQEALNYLALYGVTQNLQDSYASTPDDKLGSVQKRIEALKSGKPKAGGRSGDSILSEMKAILIKHLMKNKKLKRADIPKLPDRDAVKKLCAKHKVSFTTLATRAEAEVRRRASLVDDLNIEIEGENS